MPWYSVRRGDCLSSIARAHGFEDWKRVYDAPENSEFRRQRPDPDVIYPGDRLFIPGAELKEADAPTEQLHRFRLRRPRTMLRLVIQDERGGAMTGREYVLTVGAMEWKATIGPEGLIEHEILPDAERGRLVVFEGSGVEYARWELELGGLDPVDEVTGVQQRLNNMGYKSGPEDGIIGRRTRHALKLFQKDAGLEETGEADDATREALKHRYGA